MSTQLSGESFLAVVQKSGLVDTERLKRSAAEFQTQGGDPQNATALAEHFIARTLLSKWQAEKLLLGKHKGYFLGKYRLISLLGKGGMSSVYLAEHTLMKRRCAIKVLPTKRVGDSSYLARFHREAQAVAALDHPNIVRAYDVDHQVERDGEIHFLVMEYVDGSSLQEWVAKSGRLGFVEAVDSIRQAAVGLAHAHEAGLVHRDIKPGNLLCDPQGTVKILDLGLARFFDNQGQDEALTIQHDEKVLGTADYLAPEQALDSHTVDARADIYSLGCTLYFLLTGHPPFTEGTLTQRLMAHQTKEPPALEKERTDTPPSLTVIVRKMMAKKVDDRYASANETAEALRKWLAGNAPADWKKAHSGLFANDVTRATAVVATVVSTKKTPAQPAAAAPVVTTTPAAGQSGVQAQPAPVAATPPPAAEPELAAFFAGMAEHPPSVVKSPSSLRLKSIPPEPQPPQPTAKSPSSIKRKGATPPPKSAVVPKALPPVAAPPVAKVTPAKPTPAKAVATPSPAPAVEAGAFDFLNAGVVETESPPVFIDTTPSPAVVVTPTPVAKTAPPSAAPVTPAPPATPAAPVKATPVKATPVKAVPVQATPVPATPVKPPAATAPPAPATPVSAPPVEPPAPAPGAFDFLNVGDTTSAEPVVMIDTTVAATPKVAAPVAAAPVSSEPSKVSPPVVAVPPAEAKPETPAAMVPAAGAFDFLNAASVEHEAPAVFINTAGTPAPAAEKAVDVAAASVDQNAVSPVVEPVMSVNPVAPPAEVVAVPAMAETVAAPPDIVVPDSFAAVVEEPAAGVPFINVSAAAPVIAKPAAAKPAVAKATPLAAAPVAPAPVEATVEVASPEVPFFAEPAATEANPFAFTSPAAAVVPSVAVPPPASPTTPAAAAPPTPAAKGGGVPKIALIGGGAVIALLLVGGIGYGLGWFGSTKPVVKKSTKAKSTKVATNDDGGGASTKTTSNSPWRMKRSATVSPTGDFKTLGEALQIVKQHFTSQIRSDRFTIKVSAGTYAERIVIDGKTWPANISVVGEGAVVLEPSGADPVVQLTSVEGVQLQGLTIKAAGKPVAVQLTGNMARVKLQKVSIDGFSEAGLTLRGAAGLSFSDARCQFEDVVIRGGSASGVGVKATKHDDVDPSNLVFSRCQFVGPLAAGVTISSKDAAGIEFRESIFHSTTVGVHFLNKSSWRDDVFVQNTFHQCSHGLLIAEQPETSSKGLSIRRNLFLGTKTAEIQVEKGFDEKALIQNQMLGPIGQNWSDRARPEKPVGEIAIFGADSQPARNDLKLASTDPANAKFLAPAAGSPQGNVGGQGAGEKPWVGAVGP